MDGNPDRRIATLHRSVSRVLARHHPRDVLSLAALHTVVAPTSVVAHEPPSPAAVEFIVEAMLEREDDHEAGARDADALARDFDKALELAAEAVRLRLAAMWQRIVSAPTALDRLAATVEHYDTVVRFPGYGGDANELIRGCFADDAVEGVLRAELGFTARDALETVRIADRLVRGRFDAARRRTQDIVGPTLTDVWTLRPEDVVAASRGRLDAGAVAAFLDAFAAGPGHRAARRVTGRSTVRRFPVFAWSDGYIVASFGNLLWALRGRFEDALKGTDAWHTYEQRRSTWTEHRAAQALRRALRPDALVVNAAFQSDSGQLWEADVLVRVDDLCLVVEVKSGRLADEALRGRKGNLRRDVMGLLHHASTQAARIADALQPGTQPQFFDRRTKEALDFELAGVKRVQPVVLTLEDLTPVVARWQTIADAGLLEATTKLPWTVTLFDLVAIASTAEFAAQVTAYIERRAALDPRVIFFDEQDVWLTFLHEALHFADVEGETLMVVPRTGLAADARIFGRERPRMPLPANTHRALRKLERQRPPDWLADSERLLTDVQRERRPYVMR
jgi:hypothetical protein